VPANLQELIMDNFEMEGNLKPGGSDWSKISHVPYIRLNKKTVQNLSANVASTSSHQQVCATVHLIPLPASGATYNISVSMFSTLCNITIQIYF
jgi:hypothetical protein